MFSEDHPDKLPGGQTSSALRSRVLLGLLTDDEAPRLELDITRVHVEEMAAFFRGEFDLGRAQDLQAFLTDADLSVADFSSLMRTFRTLLAVQTHHQARVEALLPRYRALATVGQGTPR